jgi:hypothetical protein
MKDVVRTEILKLLEVGIIYPIADSRWVSLIHCVPKKGCITVVPNDKNELIPQRIVTGYRMVIDFRKLNKATRKDHYPLPFIDQMLERLSKHRHFCFLDGYSGFSQIPVSPEDQEKTTFTCPFGTYAYRRMPFGLCNPAEDGVIADHLFSRIGAPQSGAVLLLPICCRGRAIALIYGDFGGEPATAAPLDALAILAGQAGLVLEMPSAGGRWKRPRPRDDGVAKTHQLRRCGNWSHVFDVRKHASLLDNCAPCIWRFLLSHSLFLLSCESINFGYAGEG